MEYKKRISEVKAYFGNNRYPKSIQLKQGVFIYDTDKFIESHLKVVENQNKPIYLPYLERLEELKEKLQNGKT